MPQKSVHITLIAKHRVCNHVLEQTVRVVFTQLVHQLLNADEPPVECVVETAPLGRKSPRRDLRILVDGQHKVMADQFLDRLLNQAPGLHRMMVSADMGPDYTGDMQYAHRSRRPLSTLYH